VIFGYLADMVATIPTWISMEINRDELDIAPAEGQGTKQAQKETKAELLKALDEAAAARVGIVWTIRGRQRFLATKKHQKEHKNSGVEIR
jgi:hypothetical protein